MAQTIQIKRNDKNADAKPTSLLLGELAGNLLDRSLYSYDGNNIFQFYTGDAKWFDTDGNANNANKLGGVIASSYATQTWVEGKLTKANVGLGDVQNYGVFNQSSYKGKIQYALVNSSVLEIANRIDFHTIESASNDYEVSLRVRSAETTKRVIYLPASEGTLALVSQLPTIPAALKSPYALTFGSKTYDGSEAKTITADDLGALDKDAASKTYQTIISTSNKIPFDYISSKPTTLSGYGITDAISTSGGSISGAINFLTSSSASNTTSGINFGSIGHIGCSNNIFALYSSESIGIRPGGFNSTNHGLDITVNNFKFNGNEVITTSNIGSQTIKEAYLDWGGKNHSGNYGPVDAALIPMLGANRFAFMPASAVTIEYSRDGGSNWTTYSISNSSKINLFSGISSSITIGGSTEKGMDKSNYQVRITIDAELAPLYTALRKFAIRVSTNGSTGSYCSITGRTQTNYLNDTNTWTTFADKVPISGWSGWNILNTNQFITYGNNNLSYYRQIRFTFGVTSHANTVNYSGLSILEICGYGGQGWSVPSNMAKNGLIYTYDYLKNVTFPNRITATELKIGSATLSWDATNNSLKIDSNAYVDGVFSMSGLSGSGPGGGGAAGIVTIRVNGNDYVSDSGLVTLPNYPSLTGYATQSWTSSNYQPKGNYLTAVPSGYATETWVGNNYQPKGTYLTAIPSEYITESELSSKKYITGITSAMVTNALGYTPYNSSNPSGYITSAALNGYATQSWVAGKKYLTAIPSEYITETELSNTLGGYQTKITSSNKLAYSLISGTPTLATVATSGKYSDLSGKPTIPTTLPASDVYAWAKAETKPTYKWSEILEKPSFHSVATSGKYSDLSGVPTSLKNPNALTFGNKSYDGSAAKTITASDLGALTSHQSIYSFTIKNSAETVLATYTPNSKASSITLTKSVVGLSKVENTALSTWSGTSNVTTLGVITTGTWNGSKITNNYLTNSSISIAGSEVSLGGSITKSTLQSNLGLGSFAYINSLSFSALTNKPTTVSGYGITDAITSGNIGSQSVNYAKNSGSADKLSTVSKTAWGRTYWTSDGVPTSISGDMSNVGSITMSGAINGVTNITASGNIIAHGTIAMETLSSSDRKLKKNIQALSTKKALDVILKLSPSKWTWKKGGSKSYGFIAQDVQNIVKDMVSTYDGSLYLHYNQLHSFEVGAIQEVYSELELLRQEIVKLKNELKQYKK